MKHTSVVDRYLPHRCNCMKHRLNQDSCFRKYRKYPRHECQTLWSADWMIRNYEEVLLILQHFHFFKSHELDLQVEKFNGLFQERQWIVICSIKKKSVQFINMEYAAESSIEIFRNDPGNSGIPVCSQILKNNFVPIISFCLI